MTGWNNPTFKHLLLAIPITVVPLLSAGCRKERPSDIIVSQAPSDSNKQLDSPTPATDDHKASRKPDREHAPKQSPSEQSPSEQSPDEPPIEPAQQDTASSDSAVEPPEHVESDLEESEAEAEPTNEPAEISTSESGQPENGLSTYRLWLPTSMGPLLVDLDLQIAGEPLNEVFNSKMQALLQQVRDENQDEDTDSVSWQALLDHVAANPMVFGQNSAGVAGQAMQMERQYDRNKNKQVDQDEWMRFLFRDVGFHSEFRLRGTDAYRWVNRSQSPLFHSIDQNQDRRLDAIEIRNSSDAILRQIDQNADQCIDITESVAAADRGASETPWQSRRSRRHGDVAMDLSGYVNWSNLSYTMGGMLKPDQVFGAANPVQIANANSDQWISAEEAQSVLSQSPALSVVVNFGNPASVPTVTLVHPSTQADVDSHDNDSGEAWIERGGLTIAITTHDLPTNQNRVPREAFDALDADNDGLLDESEIPDAVEAQVSIENLDQDGDGKLNFEEVNRAPKPPESIWNYQVRGRAAEHSDAVFALLDLDHDGFLSTREISNAPISLGHHLGDQQTLSANDLPDVFLVQLGRGEPNQDDTRFTLSRRLPPDQDNRPNWSVQMDSNRDGDISQSEFPGSMEIFRTLDLNQDQFLDRTEIQSR